MTFEELLDQAIALLQRRGRLTYRALQLQFQLEEAHLETLKDELIYGQRLAVDEAGRVLSGPAPLRHPSSQRFRQRRRSLPRPTRRPILPKRF